jgi:hypothetical protein
MSHYNVTCVPFIYFAIIDLYVQEMNVSDIEVYSPPPPPKKTPFEYTFCVVLYRGDTSESVGMSLSPTEMFRI